MRILGKPFVMVTGVLALTTLVCCNARRSKKSISAGAGETVSGAVASKSRNKRFRSARTTRGDILSDYMDTQAEALARIEGANTERIGNEIRVTWDSAALYDFDSAMLRQSSHADIKSMAEIFVEYPDTYIIIAAHTDDEGPEAYNQKLSERRALSVSNYLADTGIKPSRIETIGYGEIRPAATNDTEEGRRKNRRVVITVRPDETLQARATQK
jgi:outer membrane protein OmpA-like peptidoglycan-associated protein